MLRSDTHAGAPVEEDACCAAPALTAVVVEPACGSEHDHDALSELPLVLLARVLAALHAAHGEKGDGAARALLRLAACSKQLRDAVASADDVWQALCRARGWAACARTGAPLATPPPGYSCWHAAFVHKRARLCVECRQLTPYVFPLLSPTFRLCERCEPGSPRYTLLTAAQACEAHGLSWEELATLPCREVRGLRSPAVEKRLRVLGQATLYLRSHVVALAEAKQRAAAADAQPGSDGEEGEEEEGEEEQFRLDDDGGDSDGEGRGRSGSRAAKLTPEAARAARKANKAAVKASNRERRQAKNTTKDAGGAEPKRYFALSASPLGGNGGGSSFGGRASGSSLPTRAGASPPVSGGNGLRRSTGAHARAAARARDAGTSPTSGGPLTRAWLEDELGAFGISGLELAL